MAPEVAESPPDPSPPAVAIAATLLEAVVAHDAFDVALAIEQHRAGRFGAAVVATAIAHILENGALAGWGSRGGGGVGRQGLEP
jgi:hypothetical protein